MKSYVICIVLSLIGANAVGKNIYDCTVKKARSGYRAKDFEPFVLTTLAHNKINIIRIIETNDGDIGYDEQFYPHSNMLCNIPGEGGYKFTSTGLPEKSINAYRIAPIAFGTNAPRSISVGFTLAHYSGRNERCVPAVYECVKRTDD
jgi:hypothetical protein